MCKDIQSSRLSYQKKQQQQEQQQQNQQQKHMHINTKQMPESTIPR